MIQSTNSTAAIDLAIYPLFEYAAFVAVITVAALLGWRARETWLKD